MLASVADVDIKAWWNLTWKGVFKTIKPLSNKAIRLLGNAVKDSFVLVSCCSLCLHSVFSHTNFPCPQQNMLHWKILLVSMTKFIIGLRFEGRWELDRVQCHP